uniref:LIM zinc-binding domain-containing protein n=1 Tax=Panagrolaimus sp. JU765 TaxID=591449 RepID=A0AC34RJC2_9BILA
MVVLPGTNIGDELQQIKSLKEKKECWQSSIKASDHVEKKSDEILEGITGHVKDRMSKIISGGDKSDSENEENDDKKKQLDAIKAQVGEIKNKWKTGEVEKAETKDAEFKDELEQLRKGGINVRNRFSERLQPADDENILKSYDRNELDTSSAAEARKSFLQGLAYQSGPVEKTATDLDNLKFTELNAFKNKFEKGESEESVGKRERQIVDLDIQLNSIKEQLEKGGVEEADMTPEDRAERKKKEIEAEFLRYKLARKRQAKKAEEAAASEPEPSDQQDKPHLDVEVKMAGKAREKFKKIEAENPIVVPVPKQTSSKSGKWDVKKDTNVEIVNRRAVEESTSEEDDESAFDVKNLMQKFKNIQSTDSKVERTNLEELEALRQQAKNLRQQFEKKTEMDDEQVEEKKKELAEEFQRLKEERAKMQDELKAEEFDRKSHREIEKEDLQIAADHASKMAAKWEKINKKEARKAEKSKMPTKS